MSLQRTPGHQGDIILFLSSFGRKTYRISADDGRRNNVQVVCEDRV